MIGFLQFLSSQPLLGGLIIGAFVLLFINELLAQFFGLPPVTSQQLVSLINRQEVIIFDIRPVEQYNLSHITGSLCMPLEELASKANWLAQKYKNKLWILVVAENWRLHKSILSLKKSNVPMKFLEGGLLAWKNAGLPLQKKL